MIPDRRVVATSTSRGPSPYQLSMVSVLHGVFSSANTASRVGRRLPLTGASFGPRDTLGWGIREGGIEPQARDPH